MLIGILMGILLMLLALAIVYLVGQNRALAGQFKKASVELYDAQVALGRFVHLEQERMKLKESVVVNFTEDQITALGVRVSARVQTILESQQESALSKLN